MLQWSVEKKLGPPTPRRDSGYSSRGSSMPIFAMVWSRLVMQVAPRTRVCEHRSSSPGPDDGAQLIRPSRSVGTRDLGLRTAARTLDARQRAAMS
ncbi:hypothetical protein PI124_g18199 [Phytophthora idaei]|nr:hypothetical protein PI125_g18858 [Phytophthora idaei]KAG3137004.1 hypothetical protein PI126_g17571 [Phytophthora idaei]KAG3236793.1 hypothetical protein PI124_g18199 [Phytophthora idaei]